MRGIRRPWAVKALAPGSQQVTRVPPRIKYWASPFPRSRDP